MSEAQRDVVAELKALRLYGMAAAWGDLQEQGGLGAVDGGRWLVEHLLRAEGVEEPGIDAKGRCVVAIDSRDFCPTEVDTLLGDASKAKRQLG